MSKLRTGLAIAATSGIVGFALLPPVTVKKFQALWSTPSVAQMAAKKQRYRELEKWRNLIDFNRHLEEFGEVRVYGADRAFYEAYYRERGFAVSQIGVVTIPTEET